MIKRMTLAAALAAAIVTAAHAAEDLGPRVEASKAAVMDLAKNLKGELQAAMKAGGPVAAITVCSERAPAIAAQQSALHQLAVGRTSLAFRNPGNAPDDWERMVLEDFERRRAAGEDPAKLVRFEVVDSAAGREFRFMKAIPTGAVCLHCHGSDLRPDVAARLDELYPQDRARGFQVGDLRGAFTVRQPMPMPWAPGAPRSPCDARRRGRRRPSPASRTAAGTRVASSVSAPPRRCCSSAWGRAGR